MTIELVSLATIAVIAVLAPIIARLIPGGAIPETVILIFAGALLGPHLAGVISLDDASSLLSDLGLAFLFLLAGFEIDPKNLTQGQGRTGLLTWCVSFVLALLVLFGLQRHVDLPFDDVFPVAIAFTTTAIGTLMPILKERGLMGTPVGDSVLAYGTWGELAPIVAIALLLGTRAAWKSLLILLLFVVIAVLIALRGKRMARQVKAVNQHLETGQHLNASTRVRIVVMLLICLLALASVFDLDIILGAFAAGFILRFLIPPDDETFLHEVDAVAYGFFIPLFFVVSGAGIDFGAVFQRPLMLVLFIVMLLLIRGLPIMVALRLDPATHDMALSSRTSVTLYCVTALPLIVAVTSVAVSADTMSSDVASIMVAAGAITVLIMPLLSGATSEVGNMHPIEAAQESRKDDVGLRDILADRRAYSKLVYRLSREVLHGKLHPAADGGPDAQRQETEGDTNAQLRVADGSSDGERQATDGSPDAQRQALVDLAKKYKAVHPEVVADEVLKERARLEEDFRNRHGKPGEPNKPGEPGKPDEQGA